MFFNLAADYNRCGSFAKLPVHGPHFHMHIELVCPVSGYIARRASQVILMSRPGENHCPGRVCVVYEGCVSVSVGVKVRMRAREVMKSSSFLGIRKLTSFLPLLNLGIEKD